MKTILFRPFERYSERVLVFAGLALAVLAAFAGAHLNVRYDGVLDMHFAPESSLKDLAVDLAVDFGALFLFLFPFAKWINAKTRAVDVLATVLIGKVPMYFAALLNAGGKLTEVGEQIMEQAKAGQSLALGAAGLTLLIVFIVLVLLFMVWSVALLYNGYKTAANAKGTKAVLFFIAALLLAEIVSKAVLYFIGNSLV